MISSAEKLMLFDDTTARAPIFVENEKPNMLCYAEKLMLLNDTAKALRFIENERPDMLCFLDKSARPLFWLLRKGWGKKGGFPQVRFLNIGREKGIEFSGAIESGDFPAVRTETKVVPSKVIVIDEKSSSEGSIDKAKKAISKLYNLPEGQIVGYSYLTNFPTWYGDPSIIGVGDPKDDATSVLIQAAPTPESAALRRELIGLSDKLKQFLGRYDSFLLIEEKMEGRRLDSSAIPAEIPGISLTWDQAKMTYWCKSEELKGLAEELGTGEVGINFAMKVYYLIKNCRLQADDYIQRGDCYSHSSRSVNYLAKKIIEKL